MARCAETDDKQQGKEEPATTNSSGQRKWLSCKEQKALKKQRKLQEAKEVLPSMTPPPGNSKEQGHKKNKKKKKKTLVKRIPIPAVMRNPQRRTPPKMVLPGSLNHSKRMFPLFPHLFPVTSRILQMKTTKTPRTNNIPNMTRRWADGSPRHLL